MSEWYGWVACLSASWKCCYWEFGLDQDFTWVNSRFLPHPNIAWTWSQLIWHLIPMTELAVRFNRMLPAGTCFNVLDSNCILFLLPPDIILSSWRFCGSPWGMFSHEWGTDKVLVHLQMDLCLLQMTRVPEEAESLRARELHQKAEIQMSDILHTGTDQQRWNSWFNALQHASAFAHHTEA